MTPLASRRRLALSFAIVLLSMLALYLVPRGYFVAATFVSTSCMLAGAFALGSFRGRARPRPRSVALGLVTAVLLYGIFAGGAWVVSSLHPFGITSASEASIYSLISSPSNPLPLQVAVLLFDSAGFESYFRGVLQGALRPRLGALAAPAVALIDASIHIASFNMLWVGATFVTDLLWGLTYHYGKGTQASFTSHFVWDLAIFMLRPVS